MQSTSQRTANVKCLSGLSFLSYINKCLSLLLFSLLFAFYNLYKEPSTISLPRSFWSLILCFNLLLPIFISVFHKLLSSLWSCNTHHALQFLYYLYSQPEHSSSNMIRNVFFTTCFLIVFASFHLSLVQRDASELFS